MLLRASHDCAGEYTIYLEECWIFVKICGAVQYVARFFHHVYENEHLHLGSYDPHARPAFTRTSLFIAPNNGVSPFMTTHDVYQMSCSSLNSPEDSKNRRVVAHSDKNPDVSPLLLRCYMSAGEPCIPRVPRTCYPAVHTTLTKMRLVAFGIVLACIVIKVTAQVSPISVWGQCGGIGWYGITL